MKQVVAIFLGIILSGVTFAQEEDPAKILSYKNFESLDKYMKEHHWSFLRKHFVDSLDGDFHLFKKKNKSGGMMYCAVHLEKYMHYQVFFDHKSDYSLVLEYDDFLLMPTGKSRFNESMENKVYSMKIVELSDSSDDRNKNLFFGKINLNDHDHHKDVLPQKAGSSKLKDYHSKEAKQENEQDRREDSEGGND